MPYKNLQDKKENDKKYREANRDKIKANKARWRLENHIHVIEVHRDWNRTHKYAGSTRTSWEAMKTRCTNPNASNYADYGGRGITICALWLGREGYRNFVDDVGERPIGTTLDRIEVNGPYNKDNCKWSTPKAQRHNQRPRRNAV